MKTVMTIFGLMLVTSATFASTKALGVNRNQCLKQAKTIVKAIDSISDSSRKRVNENIQVKIESEYSEASMSKMTDLIYVFGNRDGESYLEVSFNIDNGCSFIGTKLISQE